MLHGRFINDIDKDKRKVLVLSDKQAKELYGNENYETLLGKYVKVGQFAFQVIGIFKDDENGHDQSLLSLPPFKPCTARATIWPTLMFTFHGLDTEEANEAFEQDYRQHLNATIRQHPMTRTHLVWNRYTQSMQMNMGMSIIRTALWIIGLFTLLSGIVGVSNIMLITVKERTREFGIRKAIGAKPWSVLRLIIIESIIITAIFGYIGMLLGIAANQYMDATLGHEKLIQDCSRPPCSSTPPWDSTSALRPPPSWSSPAPSPDSSLPESRQNRPIDPD